MASPSPIVGYQVIHLLTWYSRNAGSKRTVCGIHNTLDEANTAIKAIYHHHAHEHVGWTRQVSSDGRLSYEAEDVGHDKNLKLFIEKNVRCAPVACPSQSQPGAIMLGFTAQELARYRAEAAAVATQRAAEANLQVEIAGVVGAYFADRLAYGEAATDDSYNLPWVSDLWNDVYEQVRTEHEDSLKEEIKAEMKEADEQELRTELTEEMLEDDEIKEDLKAEIKEEDKDTEELRDEIKENMREELEDTLKEELKDEVWEDRTNDLEEEVKNELPRKAIRQRSRALH